MRAVIIEDEPHAQEELKRLLQKVGPDINIVCCLDSVEESVEWLSGHDDYDLLFLDIQLSDGISFQIFKSVAVDKPVVFTTAYDAYAIQAFELNSVGYLLKPIEEAPLLRTLNKLNDQKKKEQQVPLLSEDQINSLMQLARPSYKSRIMVRSGEHIQHISVLEVAYFYAEDNVVFMMTKAAKRHLVEYTLDELGQKLNPGTFFRINRKFMIHIESVKRARKHFNSRLKLELEPAPEAEVLVSRARVAAFLDWMDQ